MEEKSVLALKPGVVFAEKDGQVWLTLNSLTRIAKDAEQCRLLQALRFGGQSPDALAGLLRQQDEGAAALTLAAFILDFEDYLES